MQYKLTLSSEQARVADKAIELLLRLKIGQFEEIPWAVRGGDHLKEFCRKRDEATPYLDALRKIYGAQKDDEWHRLYDLHQVIRKAIHDTEHPETVGVDSYPVICTSGERLAKMEVVTDAAEGNKR